ncbi:MAG: hypothetical protein ISS15_09355 [Alphaproteobacteria bacterium]|nr:hypothetical protein [Alphaproteobacteria bacterium]MBL6938791.1 hypothetical protein [Alphaproteobacteria bacterium]MBL7097852.1 hypothetical protein [Alphaproteobacteria bacterium]
MSVRTIVAGAVLGAIAVCAPVRAAEDASIARMAACQDSWLDWSKSDPAKLKALGEHFRAAYTPHDNDPWFLPKAPTTVAGLKVLKVFPQSVGMGVGLSVFVEASYDTAKKTFEDVLKKKIAKCEASDGMHSCELDLAPQRSFTLMTADDDPKTTLIGCFYLYEK